MSTRRLVLAWACVATAWGCGGPSADDAGFTRGRGLKPAALAPRAEAAVYAAAVGASFDPGPDLVLMLHPRRLPRTAGTEGGDSVPPALVTALRDAGVVRGVCEPTHAVPRDTPHCGNQQAGYVIRGSPVLQLPGDTLELYFAAEAFGPRTGKRSVAIRFEKIYQLVRSGGAWRVAREARAHEAR
jgi:hypothetical protein